MRVVVQRVREGSVVVGGRVCASIGLGLVVLVGVEVGDGDGDVGWVARKVAGLRVFDDGRGRMGCCVRDVGGSVLLVSQFTLLGCVGSGFGASFSRAAGAGEARGLFDGLCVGLEGLLGGERVGRGVFGACMEVRLVNEGPVTLVLDSRRRV